MKPRLASVHQAHRSLAPIAVVLAAVTMGCSDNSGSGTAGVASRGDEAAGESEHTHAEGEHSHEGAEHSHGEGGEHRGGSHDGEGRGEHARDGDGGHDREGEESGAELSLADRYDKVRNGARLVLAYDPASNSFTGTVQNTTEQTLERVRVEVHLSNGKELGPTKPGDLKPGETREVTLKPQSKDFDGWTAHPEVGNEEHGHAEGGEHDRREGGEHSRESGEQA